MEKGKTINSMLIMIVLFLVTLLLLFKVYISNNIYLVSRDIQKISSKIEALKEEQNILKLKVEKLNYKNSIADPLFNYKSKQEEQKKLDGVEN